jgi:hypothetical protein
MVALNTAYAAPKNAADPKKRVGDFFYEDHASVGKNRWVKCLNTQEKSSYHYETASGRSNWVNRDPIAEAWGINLFKFLYNEPLHSVDYLGLDARYGPYTDDNDRRRNSDELEDNGFFPPGPDNNTHGSEQRQQSNQFNEDNYEFPSMPNFYTGCSLFKCRDDCLTCCDGAVAAGSAWISSNLTMSTTKCGRLTNYYAAAACGVAVAVWNLANLAIHAAGYSNCLSDCPSS